jgi:hypothetical protein
MLHISGTKCFAAFPIPSRAFLDLAECRNVRVVFPVVTTDFEVVDMLNTHLALWMMLDVREG